MIFTLFSPVSKLFFLLICVGTCEEELKWLLTQFPCSATFLKTFISFDFDSHVCVITKILVFLWLCSYRAFAWRITSCITYLYLISLLEKLKENYANIKCTFIPLCLCLTVNFSLYVTYYMLTLLIKCFLQLRCMPYI